MPDTDVSYVLLKMGYVWFTWNLHHYSPDGDYNNTEQPAKNMYFYAQASVQGPVARHAAILEITKPLADY